MAYAKVEETFWHDPVVRSLSETGRSFYLYLLTCPHRNRLGCFVLDPMYAAADLRWDGPRVTEGMAELEQAERVVWDGTNRVVMILRHADHNALDNQQVVKGAIGDLRALPDSDLLHRVLDAFARTRRAHYGPLLEALAQRLAKRLPQRLDKPTAERASQPLPEPLARQPVTDTATATDTVTATEASPPLETPGLIRLTGSPPESGGPKAAVGRSVDDLERDALDAFADDWAESAAALGRLKHKGGKANSAATIRARILFPDDRSEMADPSLKGIPLAERARLFAAALIEYADQGGTEWNARAVVGFMARLHRTRGEQDREEAHRRAKANEGKPQGSAELARLHEEGIRKLAASAADLPAAVDPQALARQLAARMTMPGAA